MVDILEKKLPPSIDKLLPGLDEHLLITDNSKSINIKYQDTLINKIRSRTGIDKKTAQEILKTLLKELQIALFEGNYIYFKGLGRFYISSPLTTDNKKQVIINFQPYQSLIDKLNVDKLSNKNT